ncbi:MAG: HAMP domain-containing histidine kinase, partial [Saprospiraceae bacterium]|nr:HAMP domain-containing histidine kinase [Saprospiraceae bacterium]
NLPDIVSGRGFAAQKKNLLVSQFCVLTIQLCLVHILVDYYHGMTRAVLYDMVFIVAMLVVYFINENRKHTTAKVIMIAFLNLGLFLYAALVPEKTSVAFYFFAIVAGTYVGFGKRMHLSRAFYSLLPAILFMILEWFDYQLFEVTMINPGSIPFYKIMNSVTSAVAIFLIVKLLLDINYKTEFHLRQNEQKLQKLADQITEKNKELEQANAELDRFVYSATHDLRAPLMSVLGLVNIAEIETKEAGQKKYMDMMKERIQKLDTFIQDIMDFSRNTKSGIKREKIDFDILFDEILSNLKYLSGADKITFTKDIPQGSTFVSDRSRVAIILSNLISNAIKYHNYQSGNPQIKMVLKDEKDYFEIAISDNGPGIEKEEQPKLFDMFYRASEKSEGSGLGLYIVKEMVEKLKGEISLESTLGEGSTFQIRLPRGNTV